MESIWQDIRFGARMLWKHRFATMICAVALGLGIGANTTIFSMAEAFLLHPVPFPDADHVVALVDTQPQQSVVPSPVAPATFLDWKAEAKSFDELGASQWNDFSLTGDKNPEKVQGFLVTANYFSVLGVQPMLGRTFLAEEETVGREQELILSYGLWERRYASDPNVLGKTAKVDGKTFTIVGVMGKGFDFPKPAEAWMPMALSEQQKVQRDYRSMSVLGRLKPNVKQAEAAAEMAAISQRQAQAYPDAYKGWQLKVQSLRQYATGDLTRQYMVLLLGATGLVLLIACADVANVQFARVTGRHKELAVRTAMGASRGRIVRQLLIESVMLSCAGAVLGLGLAKWGLTVMLANMPADVSKFIAGWQTIGLDTNAFLFTLGITAVSGVLAGIMPSLLSSRANVGEVLKESGRGTSAGRSRHRLRSVLVVGEVALSLILLVGAGLLVKGFHALLQVQESYKPESLLTFRVALPEVNYKLESSRLRFHEQLTERLHAIPGVQSAALVTIVPYADGGGAFPQSFAIENRPVVDRGETLGAIPERVSPSYFSLMHIGLRDGRLLSDADGASSAPVAVISKSLAERYFGGANPIGRKVKEGTAASPGPFFTVVGIVDDVHYNWIIRDAVPTLYTSYRQAPPSFTTYVLRTAGDPLAVASVVRTQLAGLDPDLPMYEVKTQDKVIKESVIGIAYMATMMAIVGFVALVLASVGVYGVMSYSVSERTNEIGIRVAMGAKAEDILRLVVGNGMLLTVLGIAIGLPLAYGLAKMLSSILFGVKAADPFAFLGLPLILAAVAALASYLPARRALRVDPLTALRYE